MGGIIALWQRKILDKFLNGLVGYWIIRAQINRGELHNMTEISVPLTFTDAAAQKVKSLITEEENPALKLRVYITGGGCSGFQYGFTFDEKVNEGDLTVENAGVQLVIDPMSLQYLIGGTIDYTDGLEGSRFVVNNPNASSTCGCGSSFSI